METKGKRSMVCLVVLLGILSMTALAGNKQRIGAAGAQELLIPVGARGTAFAGSNLAITSGVEAIYWNPAGLSRLEHGVEAMVSHMQYIADLNVEYGALGVQAGEFGSLGFTVKTVSFGDIPVTTEAFPDGTGEIYSPTFLNLGVTYSKLLTDRISAGVTATLISEKILSTSATGFAFNVGVQYFNLGVTGLDLGVAIKNVGPNMAFDGANLLRTATGQSDARGAQLFKVQAATFELPSAMEIGVAYNRKFDDRNSAVIAGNFKNNNSQDDEYSVGAEYNFNNLFFIRGGYAFSPQVDKDPTGERGYIYDYAVGAGIHYDVGGVDLTFDYTFRHVKFFDSNNIVTVKIGF